MDLPTWLGSDVHKIKNWFHARVAALEARVEALEEALKPKDKTPAEQPTDKQP